MQKIQQTLLLLTLTVLLSACGGGGGGSATPAPPANVGPVVNAGANQSVNEGTAVTLTGSASDSDGSISTYVWSQTAGPSVTINNANAPIAGFDAPNTGALASVSLSFTLTATDNDGASSSANTTVTVNSTNQTPVANAGSDQTVDEQSTVTLDASLSSDNDGSIASYSWQQSSGQSVTLNNANTVAPTFTAPSLSTAVSLTFVVTVIDDRGASSTDSVTVTVNPVNGLNEAPVANAGADQSTSSTQTVTLDGSRSSDPDGSIVDYVWTQTAGPAVTLTNANTVMATFTAPTVTADTTLSFQLTVTDNEGVMVADLMDVLVTPQPSAVTISGKATYSNVPHNAVTSGLDYTMISQDPIRQAVVELISGTTVVQNGLTDNAGDYSFTVQPNSGTYFIRVKSRTLLNAVANWDASVVDNTNTQALYALDGSSFTVTTGNIARPTMNATTSWSGTAYTNRSGAPFHILDRVVDGYLKLLAVDPDIVLPPVDLNWSPNNNLTGSDTSSTATYLASLRQGNIGTSFFTSFPVQIPSAFEEFEGSQIFILGAADSDTDEYDGHIIVHEWGHYFENVLSRSDSIGGSHTSGDRLDMRLAFGEGFGNAWSGIMTDDPVYRDSFGSSQVQGFSIDVENNSTSNRGWYNERSVQSILYDIYDSVDDGADTLSAGLQPIYDVLVGPQKTTEGFTSIFSFSEYYRQANPGDITGLTSLLTGQMIDGTDIWGINESNDAGAVPSTNVLPVYTELSVGGGSKQICSVDDYDSTGSTADSGNKLSNMRFVRFNLATTGNYTFLVSSGPTQDIDMEIYLRGVSVAFAAPGGDGDPGDASDSTFTLDAGTYAAEAYEFDNTFRGDTSLSADECFTVEIQSAP